MKLIDCLWGPPKYASAPPTQFLWSRVWVNSFSRPVMQRKSPSEMKLTVGQNVLHLDWQGGRIVPVHFWHVLQCCLLLFTQLWPKPNSVVNCKYVSFFTILWTDYNHRVWSFKNVICVLLIYLSKQPGVVRSGVYNVPVICQFYYWTQQRELSQWTRLSDVSTFYLMTQTFILLMN